MQSNQIGEMILFRSTVTIFIYQYQAIGGQIILNNVSIDRPIAENLPMLTFNEFAY